MQVTLNQYEAVNELHGSLIAMGDFMECADAREYARTSARLFDACIDAGMEYDAADFASHEDWAGDFLARCMVSTDLVEGE